MKTRSPSGEISSKSGRPIVYIGSLTPMQMALFKRLSLACGLLILAVMFFNLNVSSINLNLLLNYSFIMPLLFAGIFIFFVYSLFNNKLRFRFRIVGKETMRSAPAKNKIVTQARTKKDVNTAVRYSFAGFLPLIASIFSCVFVLLILIQIWNAGQNPARIVHVDYNHFNEYNLEIALFLILAGIIFLNTYLTVKKYKEVKQIERSILHKEIKQ